MSEKVDRERVEMAVEFRIERAKRIQRQLMDVLRFYAEGLSVTLIAERLGLKDRHRVYFLLRVLELRDAKPPKCHARAGKLYGAKVPSIDEETFDAA